MADIFKSPKSMIRHAERHIAEFQARINAFFHDKPWAIVVEKDSDGVTNVLKVKFTKELSDELPHLVFDAANNLRSALDQIAFVVGVKHKGIDSPKSAKFPFGPTEADMLNNLAGGCKDLPTEIRDLFKGFKPYKGGNNALWALNELCNTPKHKILYPAVMEGGVVGFGRGGFTIGSGGLHIRRRWDSEKNEMEFARWPEGALQGDPNFQVTFGVTLGDVDQVIRGQEPVMMLYIMTNAVNSVLMATEAECRRIGLIT